MPNRLYAVTLSVVLSASFVLGLFLKPIESSANLRASWLGEYYDNPSLSGTPLLIQTDDAIDMNWLGAAPHPSLPSDYFSVRWTRTLDLAGGIYQFRIGGDDGFRLLIDGKMVIDNFQAGSFRTITRDIELDAGKHTLEVHYFEEKELAGVLLEWGPISKTKDALNLNNLEPIPPYTPPTLHIAGAAVYAYGEPQLSAPRLAQLMFAQTYTLNGLSADGQWVNIQLNSQTTAWLPIHSVYFRAKAEIPILD